MIFNDQQSSKNKQDKAANGLLNSGVILNVELMNTVIP